VEAIKQQNLTVQGDKAKPAGKRQPLEFIIEMGRLIEAEQFGEIILKTTAGGGLVRLKDVARIEVAADQPPSLAIFNGKPGVVLGIYPSWGAAPGRVSAAVKDKLCFLRARLPDGLRLEIAFDFAPNLEAPDRPTAPQYLLLDPTWPAGARTDRTKDLRRCTELLRDLQGVRDVLALSDNPFDGVRNRPCLLLRLAPAAKGNAGREQTTRAIRARLEQVKGMSLRVRDLSGPGSFPRCAYPVDLAIHGPDADKAREMATKLGERLGQTKKLTDLWLDPESTPQPQVQVTLDRTALRKHGLQPADVMSTIEYAHGSLIVNRFGGTRPITIQADPPFLRQVEDIKQLKIRDGEGKMVPLSKLAKIEEIRAPLVVQRFNRQPMVEITANVGAGTLAQIRQLCETLAGAVRQELRLPETYRLIWLR